MYSFVFVRYRRSCRILPAPKVVFHKTHPFLYLPYVCGKSHIAECILAVFDGKNQSVVILRPFRKITPGKRIAYGPVHGIQVIFPKSTYLFVIDFHRNFIQIIDCIVLLSRHFYLFFFAPVFPGCFELLLCHIGLHTLPVNRKLCLLKQDLSDFSDTISIFLSICGANLN